MINTSMKHYEKLHEGRLIGALLRVPFLAVVNQVYSGLQDSGYLDITYAHLAVFRHIDEVKGSRLIDLAEEAQITKQSMGYLVDQLEAQGYVERVPDESDGRARLIRLTDRGQAVAENAKESVRAVQTRWTEHLGDDRMACLLDALRDLTTLLEGK